MNEYLARRLDRLRADMERGQTDVLRLQARLESDQARLNRIVGAIALAEELTQLLKQEQGKNVDLPKSETGEEKP